MKRHFIKKYIFTVLFLLTLYGYSIINFKEEGVQVLEVCRNYDGEEISSLVQQVESCINENVYEKYSWIEVYGTTQEVLGTNVENGFSYAKDSEGALYYANESYQQDCVESNIDQMIQIIEITEESGAKPFVLLAPDKYDENKDTYEEGIPYVNDNPVLDQVVEALQEEEVPYIDTRDYIEDIEAQTEETLFYDTDHHWRTKAAFYMFQKLIGGIETAYDENLDPQRIYCDLENYNIVHYEDYFLGSMGRETGVAYAGLDDFDLIYPQFDTNYEHTYRSTADSDEVVLNGNFMSSILETYNMRDDTSIYETDRYSVYLGAVNMEDHILNLNQKEGPKVLIIRDSFMAPVAAFFSEVCSEMDLIWDVRYGESIEELIRNGDYDYVIIESGTNNLANEDIYLGL
ncbi:MAG: DHHW family protein [Roseburia sp.]